MPLRSNAEDLSSIFHALGHPDRLKLIGELQESEKDVQTLQHALGVPQARVSQHLAVLRSHHMVQERREGRHVFYSLTQAAMADWLVEGLAVLEQILIL